MTEADGFLEGGDIVLVTVGAGAAIAYNYTGSTVIYGGIEYPIYISDEDTNAYIFGDVPITSGTAVDQSFPSTPPPLCLTQETRRASLKAP